MALKAVSLAQFTHAGYNSCVRLALHVATPPEKPHLIYDGDCNFCKVWINRWRHSTHDRVEYVPFQDSSVVARFPELPRTGLLGAVHLVETDGSVYSGAEAALRALGYSDREPLLLDWYLRWPGFARLSETVYRFVASHREFFSVLTRIGWGRHVEPSSYILVRSLFLRGLGGIYLIAFLSLWVQIMGLIGSNGILPANLTMFGFRQEANMAHVGWARFHLLPTLCWFSTMDGFIQAQCAAGTCLALLVMFGIAPAPCLFLLWLIYLSLAVVSREFLSYQWDNLLLETGLLSVFFAPLHLFPGLSRSSQPIKAVLWLLRWLLFRLMLGSGLVKLLSGDPNWKNLSALKFHYETQPLPTWIAWYAHQLPARAQQASSLFLLIIELGVPFLIFAPRRVRRVPCVGFVLLQILILLTGNYCFFNLLAILLCLVLLDDAALMDLIPARWRRTLKLEGPGPHPREPDAPGAQSDGTVRRWHRSLQGRWPIQVIFPLTCIAILIPTMQLSTLLQARIPWPGPLIAAYTWLSPFRSFNDYGLFAVMTTNRFEIVVQGSNDGVTWVDYEFKYKPGDPKRRPRFAEPHQPRLDWQMWFAAFSDYQHNPWFVEFCVRVMSGSPEVLALFERNPFPKAPPRYLRAVVYQYHFTDFATRRKTGAWWRRELKGDYLPVLSMRQPATQRHK